jgi:hypothetical protein
MDRTLAAVETAKRKIKRAGGLLKDATRDLAALTEGQDALGVLRAQDRQSIDAARDLISVSVAHYGAVEVIVLARPAGRAHTHPTAAMAAKENTHGTHSE